MHGFAVGRFQNPAVVCLVAFKYFQESSMIAKP